MKKKILFIVGTMNRWGTETYVYHVIKKLDKQVFDVSILVKDKNKPGEYANELKNYYGVTFYSLNILPRRKNFFRYQFHLYNFLTTNGPFDIVHANATEVNGYYLPAAYFAKIPIRISHSHNDNSYLSKKSDFLWKYIYQPLLKILANTFMSDGITISQIAGKYLFGDGWQHNNKIHYIHCGLDFTPFSEKYTLSRKDFNINDDQVILFSSGRFYLQKNHDFLINVANDLIKRKNISNIKFLLAGEGELKDEIIKKIDILGLSDFFIFIGSRDDIPALLNNVADIFLFPSLFEGLGLAFIEAQCSGTISIVSSEVPTEGDILDKHIYRLRIDNGFDTWSTVIEKIIKNEEYKKVDKSQCYEDVMQSTFNIEVHMEELLKIYLKGNH